MNKKIICIIPSRIGSTRLPRKALALIQGKPMVQRVYEQASLCKLIDKVIVATDSTEIADVINKIGGNVELTSSDIKTGTDRVAVVAKKYSDADVIINLQGDEPFIQPEMLEELVAPYFSDNNVNMTTIARPITTKEDYNNPNIVKVILDNNKDAIYFSRSAIPHLKSCQQQDLLKFNSGNKDANTDIDKTNTAGDSANLPIYHHVGIYAFTKDFLQKYTELSQTKLEQLESLEQLRVLEHGYKIRVAVSNHKTLDINNAEQLEAAQTF